MGFTPAGYEDNRGSFHFHFPDGNATMPVVGAQSHTAGRSGPQLRGCRHRRVDYAELDRPASPVRLRLNSIAIPPATWASPPRTSGEITYLNGGKPRAARARDAILALLQHDDSVPGPELPDPKKMRCINRQTPLVYTSVALRTGKPSTAQAVSV